MAIDSKIKVLENYKDTIRDLVMELVNADKNIYHLDLLAWAVANRSVSIISGFLTQIVNSNFLCAAPLVRLHMDNLLRFYAAWLVKNPHDFANKVISGEQIRRLKDEKGNLLTDKYLSETLSKQYPWIQKVYDNTSGYIHLSDKHIFTSVTKIDKIGMQLIISERQEYISNELYEESIECMIAISEILLDYFKGWIETKKNSSNSNRNSEIEFFVKER